MKKNICSALFGLGVGLLLSFLFYAYWSARAESIEKMYGLSFVGSRVRAEQRHIDPVLQVNATHASVMPFGFLKSLQSGELLYDKQGQWYGERPEGVRQYIRLLHRNGLHVMLKPQIWVWKGSFTGDIAMESEEDWKRLERSYEEYIMLYAQIANEEGVEVFCIGTELERFVEERTDFWRKLIGRVRSAYKGKLTYAANWDEYGRFPLWDQLDYIGVDAYFPLSQARNPSEEEIRKGWQRWKPELKACSSAWGLPILFTEYGYRSMDYGLEKPWLVDRNRVQVNERLQQRAYRVMFEEIWDQPWFAGGFLWKWFIEHSEAGGASDNRFTPQNKAAQEVIRDFYGGSLE